MESFGIKATIYDFFAYFMSGVICIVCIIFAIYFSNYDMSVIFNTFKNELFTELPILLIIFISTLIVYIFGLLISTISSILIEKWLMGKITKLNNYFCFSNILNDNVYNLFMQKFTDNYNFTFEKKDIRLVISSIEEKAVNSYSTAFIFLTIYGTYRNICTIFFATGLFAIIINIVQCIFPLFGIILMFFSLISLMGYIRFYRYFISQIVSTYINTNK